ncbi:MAG: hypothetical protein ABIU20_02135 [Blastocatellia bacterium]
MHKNEVIANQLKILANQDQIKQSQTKLDLLLANQETIQANQTKLDALLANQDVIQANQAKILANQTEIISLLAQ